VLSKRLNRAARSSIFVYDCVHLDANPVTHCFSRYHFLRLFRQAFKQNAASDLVERRSEKARIVEAKEPGLQTFDFEVGFSVWGSV